MDSLPARNGPPRSGHRRRPSMIASSLLPMIEEAASDPSGLMTPAHLQGPFECLGMVEMKMQKPTMIDDERKFSILSEPCVDAPVILPNQPGPVIPIESGKEKTYKVKLCCMNIQAKILSIMILLFAMVGLTATATYVALFTEINVIFTGAYAFIWSVNCLFTLILLLGLVKSKLTLLTMVIRYVIFVRFITTAVASICFLNSLFWSGVIVLFYTENLEAETGKTHEVVEKMSSDFIAWFLIAAVVGYMVCIVLAFIIKSLHMYRQQIRDEAEQKLALFMEFLKRETTDDQMTEYEDKKKISEEIDLAEQTGTIALEFIDETDEEVAHITGLAVPPSKE